MTEDLAVTLARVEGKLDAYAAQRVQDAEKIAELDSRLRLTASREDVEKIDGRLRSQETRAVVTPAGLLASLVGTVTILGGFVALVQNLHL